MRLLYLTCVGLDFFAVVYVRELSCLIHINVCCRNEFVIGIIVIKIYSHVILRLPFFFMVTLKSVV
jgi:hypothetical protein